MLPVTDLDAVADGHPDGAGEPIQTNPIGTVGVAILAGGALGFAAHAGATALLVAVAVVQALTALAWAFGTNLPGRRGAVIVAGLAAAGADVIVSLRPHSRLGDLVIVFGLVVPVMFVHQLTRGAARVRVVTSMSGTAVGAFTVVCLAALLQLRHEFGADGGRVTTAVVVIIAGGVVVSLLLDMVMPLPRFDASVSRGLFGVIAAGGLGGSIGHLSLTESAGFPGNRGLFAGAVLGTVAGLLSIALDFVEHSTPLPTRPASARLRPVLGAAVPLCLCAPLAFMVCLVLRS
jgi:hypothetical protein